MAGILGLYHNDAHFRIGEEIPEKLAYQIRHWRDGQAIFQPAPNVGLGGIYHRDVEQPCHVSAFDEQRTVYVLLDGFIILRGKEPSKWHGNEKGDAELILGLYGEKGIGFLDEVDGSYAIAIWDGNRREMIFIRDRLGYKSLFYTKTSNAFVFASEIKAILASTFYEKSESLQGVDSFLSYGYLPNPGTL